MSVIKSFGFGNGSPFTTLTFNKNNELVFAKNGPLSIGEISQDLPLVLLKDITFIQQGIIVEKTGTTSVTFPTDLPVPFYLTAHTPDATNIDNIIYSFVRRPQDIGEGTALIAEWDGQEWRHLDKLSLGEFVKEREKRARAYGNLGFNNGFRFSPNSDFSVYSLSPGQITDKTGYLVTKETPTIFNEITPDIDFDRLDAILWRRLSDDPNRIGFPILRPGGSFSGTTITQIKNLSVSGNADVNSRPKILVHDDNSYTLFYIEKYGLNGELRAIQYAEDRTTVVLTPVVFETGVLDYDVSITSDGNINIVFIKDSNLFRMKIKQVDFSVITNASAVDGLTNPVSSPVIQTDYLGNQHIIFLYQLAPTTFTPYYMKLNVGGTVSKSPFRLRLNSDTYSRVDFKVNDDLELFVAYSNETKNEIYTQKLDEVGLELTGVALISGDTYDATNDVVLVGSSRNAQINVSENNTVYVSWEQEKGAGKYGLCLYDSSLINKIGHIAKLMEIDSPTEDIDSHVLTLDWQNHAHILFSDGTELRYFQYFLPALNTRLLSSFIVSAVNSVFYALAFDKKGSLVQSYVEIQSGTTNNGGTITDFKTGAATYGSESVFLAANEIAVRQSELNTLNPIPTIEDSFNLTGSFQGNSGTYIISAQKPTTINGITYTIYTLTSAFAGAEDNSGATLQFTELSGNDFRAAKQPAAILYSAPEMYAEELLSDLFAVVIRKSDNKFITWYDTSFISADSPTSKIETMLTNPGDINWSTSINNGTLTWAQEFKIIDPFRGIFFIAPGNLDNIAEDQALYVQIPQTQYLLQDGDTNTLKITDVSEFTIGDRIFISDSDSTGKFANVTAIGLGELTVDILVDEFVKIRGAYCYPADIVVKKESRNNGILKPSSLGNINSNVYLIAYRKDNLVYFRDGGVTLEDGETGNIGDGTSSENLAFMGAFSEADSTPKYSTALGGSITNFKVSENESLTKAIKKLDKRDDTIPRASLIDLVRTALPLTSPATIDGITITTGVIVFFPYVDEKVYSATVAAGVISWAPIAIYGEGADTPVDGKMLKITSGNTPYLKTIWERTSGEWTPLHVKDATNEPSGFKFEDLSDSALSFDNNTRTFTITPTGDHFDYFVEGKVYRKIAAVSVQIPDTEGGYFFYFDGPTLIATNTFDINIILDKAYVSYTYWDQTNQDAIILGEERHGITMDGATHRYLHNTRGTQIQSGFSIGTFDTGGDGTATSDATVSIGDGTLYDEDLILNVTHSVAPSNPLEQILTPIAQIPVYYRDGASGYWRKTTANDYPLNVGANRMVYNSLQYSVWQQVEVPADNNFATSWVFATNNTEEPVIVIMGQASYTSLSEAQEQEVFSALTLGNFPFAEWKLCFRLIYETDSTYSNGAKSALRDILDLRAGADLPFPSVSLQDHGLLSGLDDPDHGPTAVTTLGVIKDGGLSETDVDLDQSLDTLNKLLGQLRLKEHPTDKKRVIVTGANRILNSGTEIIQELKNLVLEFDGAEIDFGTGNIYEADGVTPLGDPFVPEIVPTNEYLNYSVTLLPNIANEILNTITGQLIILPAPGTNITKANSPKPPFAKGTKLGFITVQENAGSISNIFEEDISQLGTGGGGGGAGDANELEGRLQNRLNLTDFKYAGVNIFAKSEDDLIDDTSTATFSVVNTNYAFENVGDFLLSLDMFGSQFLNNNSELNKIELTHYIDTLAPGLDSVVEVSRDGGNSFQTLTMKRVGVSDTFRGIATFNNTDTGYTQIVGTIPTGFEALDNVNSLSEPIVLAKKTTIKDLTINVQVTGTPDGFIYAEFRKDNSGSPDMTPAGFVGRTKFIDVTSLVDGNVVLDSIVTAPAGNYHIVLLTEDTYKATYIPGTKQIAINNAGAGGIRTSLSGYEHDLRIRITRGPADLTSQGFGILYQFSKGEVFVDGEIKQKTFKFNGTVDNLDTFDLGWNPDRRVLMVFEKGTGQVYRYGLQGFLISGTNIVFEPNTFNKPEDIELEAVEFMGTAIINDDFFTGLLSSTFIGSPGLYQGFLKEGRGVFMMRPDGVIREITIDDNDELQVYSI